MKRTGKTIIIIFFLFLLNGCYTTFSRVDVISGENYEEKNSEKWSNLFSSLLSSGLPFSLSIGFSRSIFIIPTSIVPTIQDCNILPDIILEDIAINSIFITATTADTMEVNPEAGRLNSLPPDSLPALAICREEEKIRPAHRS